MAAGDKMSCWRLLHHKQQQQPNRIGTASTKPPMETLSSFFLKD